MSPKGRNCKQPPSGTTTTLLLLYQRGNACTPEGGKALWANRRGVKLLPFVAPSGAKQRAQKNRRGATFLRGSGGKRQAVALPPPPGGTSPLGATKGRDKQLPGGQRQLRFCPLLYPFDFAPLVAQRAKQRKALPSVVPRGEQQRSCCCSPFGGTNSEQHRSCCCSPFGGTNSEQHRRGQQQSCCFALCPL